MARPKKETEVSAQIKIENAFWELISMQSYSKITIQKLANQAKVNRNAVYYHFENVDDVAKKTFHNLMTKDIVEKLIRMLLNSKETDRNIYEDKDYLASLQKLQMCARSDSYFLRQMLKDEIKRNWFRIAGIQDNKLETMDILVVDFVLSGIVNLLGSAETQKNPTLIFEFSKTNIGQAILEMILQLAK